mgnify:CR=1 FL=1
MTFAFDDGRVQLLLALGPVSTWLPELVASVDAFYLDGFAPARNPQMWDQLNASVPFPKRLGEPPEFASLVLEIARNGYLNAHQFRLDGGIRMPPK